MCGCRAFFDWRKQHSWERSKQRGKHPLRNGRLSKPREPTGVRDAGELAKLGDVKAGDPARSHMDGGME